MDNKDAGAPRRRHAAVEWIGPEAPAVFSY
jgi:hypothetical protein